MTTITDRDLERFAAKITLPAPAEEVTACWEWHGAKHSATRGYGKFRLGGKPINAHKASFLMFKGAVGPGMVIGHLCNNERCVNPHHLVAQPQTENMKYCIACGRHASQKGK